MKNQLTVCMPVYNGSKYLNDSIGSILGQTYSDFTLVCYDDGSTDGSVDVIKSIKDKRIKLILGKENKGGIWARTQLIKQLKTPYCMWLDDDDRFCRNDAFEIAMNVIAQGEYDMVNFVRIRNLYKDGHTEIEEPCNYDDFIYCGNQLFEKFYPTDNHFLFNSKIFSSDLLKSSIPDDEILSQRFCTDDMFFAAMWFFNAKRYCNLASCEPILEYKKDIGLWGSKMGVADGKRIGELCVLLYNVLYSLYNRMVGIRPINAIELNNLVVGTNIEMICKMIRNVRRKSGDEEANYLMNIYHSAFASDGKHLLNDIDAFEFPRYIERLENIMKDTEGIPIKME